MPCLLIPYWAASDDMDLLRMGLKLKGKNLFLVLDLRDLEVPPFSLSITLLLIFNNLV